MILNKRLGLLFISILLLANVASSQVPRMLRSSVNMSGSSSTVSLNGSKFYYQQSIGQDGLIGFKQSSTFALRQGFIQPLVSPIKLSKNDNHLIVSVFPNPTRDFVNFSFADAITNDVFVTIYSSMGSVVRSFKYSALQELTVSFDGLVSGLYIVRISSNDRTTSVKLVKE